MNDFERGKRDGMRETLNKELNEDLNILNNKSIVLPLGEVTISKR